MCGLFFNTLSLQQKSNKSWAPTYFLSAYYGPGVTVAMYVHMELFHNGLVWGLND